MHLKRFDAFVRHLEHDASLQELGALSDIYVRAGDDWRDSGHGLIIDEMHQDTLERVLTRNHHWRGEKSLRAFFPVATLKAVVAVQTATPSRASTRNKIQQIIADVLKHSTDEFDAQHDGLTGIANSRLIEQLAQQAASPEISVTTAEGFNVTRTVALLALDIDHFKQVNDSFGHQYGDLVLRCFAQRLEHAAETIRAEFTDIDLVPGRLSGEEFVVLVSGIVSQTAVMEIAERVRLIIADTPLPSDTEWHAMPSEQRGHVIALPHVSDRKITASVGVSALLTPSPRTAPAIMDLRREADAALYRAKAGGRNTVRWFPEIRDKYGSVLEHHADTGVVVIDIGSHVNVRRGNEFLVYHPDFTGAKTFIFADGRTQKRLGTYPKMPCGRMVVFDVQPEISFATVQQGGISRIPVGATTEYIPAGSIAHLLREAVPVGLPHSVNLSSVEQLDSFIKRNAEAKKLCVVVCTLNDVENLELLHGVVFVNHALAGLYESIRETLPRDAVVSQIQSNSLAVAFVGAADIPKAVEELLAKARSRTGDGALSAGVFKPTAGEAKPGDKTKLDPTRALDLARYAALPAAHTSGNTVEVFSPGTAARLLYAQRTAQRANEVRADYKAFKEAGIVNASVETQAALTELAAGELEAALTYSNRACELQPEDNVIQANRATIEFALGRPLVAHKIFESISSKGFKLSPPYLAVRALAAFEQHRNTPNSVAQAELRQMLATAKDQARYPANLGIKKTDVDDALAKLTSGSPVSEGEAG